MPEPQARGSRSLVTIAITTRDRSHLLRRAIRSALAQTVTAIEVVVVDDGSVHPVVLEEDPRLTLVRLEPSRGVSAARNAALARATGEWIAFLDDDDELTPDFAERALRAASRSVLPPPVAVLAAIEVVDADGRLIRTMWPITLARGDSFFVADSDHPQFQFANSLLAPTAVVRDIGGWDERFRAWEVEDFLLRLSRAASLQGTSERTYRIHDHRGPRLGSDAEAMLGGARLTLLEHRSELVADRARRARYFGAMAFIEFQRGRPQGAIGPALTSFLLDPRLPERPDHWLRALVRPTRPAARGRRQPPGDRRTSSGRLGRSNTSRAAAMPSSSDPAAEPRAATPRGPRLTIGLVVYNGERYLASAIESLLGQTFGDFELIISDNGSTDGTVGIAIAAAERDDRVRYVPHPRNRGLAWNLNYVVGVARGEYFMWAGHDDLHGPDFIERCVAALDADSEVVYAYGDTFLIDSDGLLFGREINRFALGVRSPNRRFWEQLVVRGGQNFYGILRTSVLRSIAPHGSIPWAERVMFAELALRGRFALVPDATFYWRRHPDQLTAIWGSRRAFTDALDPGRSRWRRSTPMLIAEYLAGYQAAIMRSPMEIGEKLRCEARLARWLISHLPGLGLNDPRTVEAEIATVAPDPQGAGVGGDPESG